MEKSVVQITITQVRYSPSVEFLGLCNCLLENGTRRRELRIIWNPRHSAGKPDKQPQLFGSAEVGCFGERQSSRGFHTFDSVSPSETNATITPRLFLSICRMARLSGLQREVLSLYRKCLREIRKKPAVSSSSDFTFPGFGKLRQCILLTSWFFLLDQESRNNFKSFARYARL